MNWNIVLEMLSRPLGKLGDLELSLALIIQFLVTVLLVGLLARFIARVMAERILSRTRLDESLRYTLARVTSYVVWVVGLLIGLTALGIDLTSLTVIAGALGVGIGFGLQNIVNNLVSGLILLGERSIAIGDRVDVGDVQGRVVRIGARSTSILTNDNIVIIVPNAEFIQQRVVNWSHGGDQRVRLRLPVGVSYNSDPRQVETLILQAAQEEPACLKDPEPTVVFLGFGNSSIDFELRAWTAELTHRPNVFRGYLYHRIWDKFKEHEIEIPFPQRDLHLREPLAVKVQQTTD